MVFVIPNFLGYISQVCSKIWDKVIAFMQAFANLKAFSGCVLGGKPAWTVKAHCPGTRLAGAFFFLGLCQGVNDGVDQLADLRFWDRRRVRLTGSGCGIFYGVAAD